jgi:hypothetical protein
MESIFDLPAFNDNLFFPRRDFESAPPGAEDVFVPAAPGIRVHARRYLNDRARLSLLYFHGNGEIVRDHDDMAPQFAEAGAELVVAEYRGYGMSDGRPTLRAVLQDAHAVYRFLREKGILRGKVAVMGRSLGSGPAIELCSCEEGIDGCVIESGYADPIALLRRRGLDVDMITPEEERLFDNSRKIASVRCPLLVMHGEDDALIAPQEACLNYENAGSSRKKLVLLPMVGHNDIFYALDGAYFRTLGEFFAEIAGPDPDCGDPDE